VTTGWLDEFADCSLLVLVDDSLAGYNGRVELLRYHRSWWRRLLHIRPKKISRQLEVEIVGDTAIIRKDAA
jgi:hypothetical protein